MNLFELTRALVDIESMTNREQNVADFLFAQLSRAGLAHVGRLERIAVEPNRDNIFACWGEPDRHAFHAHGYRAAFFPSLEDAEFIWGRGSCDAKGIIAAMIAAAEKLLDCAAREISRLLFRRRRRAQQRGRESRRGESARLAISDQWRAHRKSARARLKGSAALRNHRAGKTGALRVSGAGPLRDSLAARCVAGHSRDSAAARCHCSAQAR